MGKETLSFADQQVLRDRLLKIEIQLDELKQEREEKIRKLKKDREKELARLEADTRAEVRRRLAEKYPQSFIMQAYRDPQYRAVLDEEDWKIRRDLDVKEPDHKEPKPQPAVPRLEAERNHILEMLSTDASQSVKELEQPKIEGGSSRQQEQKKTRTVSGVRKAVRLWMDKHPSITTPIPLLATDLAQTLELNKKKLSQQKWDQFKANVDQHFRRELRTRQKKSNPS